MTPGAMQPEDMEDRRTDRPGAVPGATPPEDAEIPTGASSSGELRSPDQDPGVVDDGSE